MLWEDIFPWDQNILLHTGFWGPNSCFSWIEETWNRDCDCDKLSWSKYLSLQIMIQMMIPSFHTLERIVMKMFVGHQSDHSSDFTFQEQASIVTKKLLSATKVQQYYMYILSICSNVSTSHSIPSLCQIQSRTVLLQHKSSSIPSVFSFMNGIYIVSQFLPSDFSCKLAV